MIVTHYEMPDSQGDPDGHVVHCPVCDRECEEATEVRLGI